MDCGVELPCLHFKLFSFKIFNFPAYDVSDQHNLLATDSFPVFENISSILGTNLPVTNNSFFITPQTKFRDV